ncbi:MAG: FAD-dependent oxidoreductase [Candidatus Zixiibacteriota bacterium]|nr:MAG: FAD-dependent oxidoreductase [candidate division Zixibacteria bacterium]
MNIGEKSDIVIVGGVAAGPKTAATLVRRLPKARITIFEKSNDISFATCGLPYYASGDVGSFEALTLTSYGVPRDRKFFRNSRGFEVITGAEVAAIDRKKKLVRVYLSETGESIEHGYDKLVLATGAKPQKPPFPIADSSRIRHFTRPNDAICFRESAQKGEIGKVLIVGGGFIGCELAEAVGGMWGIETILAEKELQLLPYVLDEEMSDLVTRELTGKGVKIMLGVCIDGIGLDGAGKPVVKIDKSETIAVDYVFLCLGVRPNVALAEECGLVIGETGGIAVDGHMQTSDQDIFAGGDCVESISRVTGKKLYMPMGSIANRHGRIIAENIAGADAEFPGVTGSFLVKVYDVNVGAVGISQREAEKAGINAGAVWASFVDKPDYYPESKSFTLKMVYDSDSGRLLGLQAVGAGDVCRRIDVFSSFLQKEASIRELIDFEHGYAPPYSEALDPLYHVASIALARQWGIDMVSPGLDFEDGEIVWLDVREKAEAAEAPWSPFDGSQIRRYINIPLNELKENLDKLGKADRIMIICRRGARSYQAAVMLKHAGYNNVHIVGGGTQAAAL